MHKRNITLGGAYELLVGGATDSEITERLLYIVRERMGLKATAAAIAETVKALRTIQLPKNKS